MRLKLGGLQHVVKRVLSEERLDRAFCDEVSRALGFAVIVEGSITDVAQDAGNVLDVMEATGKDANLAFKTSVMVKMLEHRSPVVRAFAARVVPKKFVERSMNDEAYEVVVEAAKRLPFSIAKKALRRFPNDDLLESIVNSKLIAEDGIKQPKTIPLELDIYGEERLGDAGKQLPGDDDLSDQWYETTAARIFQDYGRAIEHNWEESAAHAFCSHAKSTSGVDVDEKKLLKAIIDLIEEREDRVIERDALKESLDWCASRQNSEINAFPVIFEQDDVEKLVESDLSAAGYLVEAAKVFGIDVEEPVLGTIPSADGLRRVDEVAFDKFCRSWEIKNPGYRLSWSPCASDGIVRFRTKVK